MDYDKNTTIWHPFTQHGLNEPIIHIDTAKNEFLYTRDGDEIIDGISSWWVNTLGHSNPDIIEAVKAQADKLQQLIFAGFTHTPAEEVAQKIKTFLPKQLEYVFFSDSGSTSIEVALKMAVGSFYNKGVRNRTKIVAFDKGYHGDTFGGMASGGRSVFNNPYVNMLFETIHLPAPEKGREDVTLAAFKELLETESSNIAAIIIEPLILGSGGMLMYDSSLIDELYRVAKSKDLVFILDEVMTGFGRTGTMFAFQQTNIVPDIICLSKGLSGGHMPLALTIATKEIYDAFYSESKADMFYHSSSYTANPIACAATAANLTLWENGQSDILAKIEQISNWHKTKSKKLSQNSLVTNPRILGSIFAFDIDVSDVGFLSDIAIKLYSYYLSKGVLLRPLGNTVYVMPPYCISEGSLDRIYDTIESSLEFIKVN